MAQRPCRGELSRRRELGLATRRSEPGFSPPDVFCASLSACLGPSARIAAGRMGVLGWLGEFRARVTDHKAADAPARIGGVGRCACPEWKREVKLIAKRRVGTCFRLWALTRTRAGATPVEAGIFPFALTRLLAVHTAISTHIA